MASEKNKEDEGSKQSINSTPLSKKKNRGERKSTNPLNWYSCKGVTFMNGDIHKDQRHPRCFGIRSKIIDADMLDVLHHERPQKHWKSNKAIDLRKGDFFHTCVGSSHFSIPSSKKAVNPKRQQLLFEKDLARCRSGLDIFSGSSNDDKKKRRSRGQITDDTAVEESSNILTNQNQESKEIFNKSKKKEGVPSLFEDDGDEIDIVDELKRGGKYALDLGERTGVQMKENWSFLRDRVFTRTFPQRFMQSSNRIIAQFEPTYNNCITFGKKLWKTVFDEDFDDDN